MPQLDFTIWLSNALINWVFLFLIFMYINSANSSIIISTPISNNATDMINNNPWNWN